MKKFLLSLFTVAATFAVSAAETTYTVDFTSTVDGKALATTVATAIKSQTEATLNLNGDTWTFTNATTGGSSAQKDTNGRGIQIGTSKATPKTVTFSTDAFNAKTITAVKLDLAGNGGDYTIKVDGTSVYNGTYTASSGTATVTAEWNATTPVSCNSGFSFDITAKSGKALFIKSFTITYDEASVPVDPNALANLVIKYGDDVTVSENDAISVTEGTTFEISADNAESITISGLNGKLMSVPTNTCIWTPEAMEEDLITVTATKGEQTLETMFTLVVTAPDTRVDANLSFAEATVNHDINDAFTAQQLTNPENLTVTWSSSNDKVASIDATSGDITINATGTTTIRADFAGDDAFKPGSAEYTLVVADRNVQIVTFDFINADYGMVRHTAGTDYNPDPITFGNGWIGIKATGRNRLWSTKGLRVYKDATITIYAPEGCALTSIESNRNFIINETKTEATYTHTNSSNSDLEKITVTYTGATDEELAAAFQAGSSLSLTIENAEYAEGTCVKSSEADAKVSIANVYPHAKIYYSWTADAAEAATFAEAGYEEYTAPLSLDRAGQLNYYAELNGQRTAVQTLTVTGPTTTGISEIEATGATSTEWFDLSGRRVAAPAKGVYLRKQGAKVTKIAY